MTLSPAGICRCQAEALDGGKRWKNEKEEKGPAAGFGSPSKGQAINLLDTVSGGTGEKTKYLLVQELSRFDFAPLPPGSARIPQAECEGAEGLRGHPAAHQVLLPHRP